ncbi:MULTISPECIES: DMT family transporter [Lysinibacillus]|uniref:DMT family transporter n=1 Tax=Lysinibacillus TaxID=400634 RepID=UPI000883738F|nr:MULTISPECIES: DMT family transporter [unclassified Lysinibacillus]MEE3806123.1 DMT family transporter [Lysinibacillus fusiformis]SCZ06685.1 Permease of the drug/metabolite transporter (DMT) superfamily [Lysinibacillus sp. SG9]SDB52215.1 Permease of the drug/metabolite transporter (DMT) superfamily [Lysinibacillus sp. TC-37]SFT16458.1 Permease of the drug/metabolite transporter (DMT) superfamily [Lysinibacillus sp. SG55]
MNQIIQRNRTMGFLLVILGASFWGIGGTVAQRLFQQDDIEVGWLVSSRLLLAGLLLLAIYKITYRHDSIFVIWRTKQNAFKQILFSLLGMLAVQYTYMMSIAIGNSAVATLLQYLAPLFIMAYFLLTRQNPLTKQDGIAVTLTLVGTFLLLTNGSVSTLSVPFMAVLWGVLSGLSVAFYTLYAIPLLQQFHSLLVVGWSMIIGGAVMSIFHPPWAIDVSNWTFSTVAYFLFIIIFGTMLAFWFYIASLHYLSPKESSLLGSLEPLMAVITSVWWLKITFGGYQFIGTLLILLMILYLTVFQKKQVEA